jgi:CheY-like chemotaxis protein
MTANVTQVEKEKCTEAGMNSYLAKPFKPEELLSKLAAVGIEIKKVIPGAADSKPKFVIAEQIPTVEKFTDMTFLNMFTRGDKAKIAKYISMFLDSCTESLEQMNLHLQSGNYDRLRGTAHALKPQITYMGIHAGEDLIKKIELNAAEKKDVEQLPKMFDEFRKICDKAIPELKQVIHQS